MLSCTSARRTVSSLGAFGFTSQKMIELYSNIDGDIFDRFIVKKGTRRKRKAHDDDESDDQPLVQLAPTKGRWVDGDKTALKKSAAY
eukprot:1875838-Pyramimonas_sp.AAC.1